MNQPCGTNANGLTCDTGLKCIDLGGARLLCKVIQSVNQPCGTNANGLTCDTGLKCIDSGSEGLLCKALLYSDCTRNSECISNYCEGKCVYRNSIQPQGYCFKPVECLIVITLALLK